ncbi:hypothetical protein ACGFZG_35345 [Streptomyces antibioticus]|uniref:hypothetical protein n=1 Tax=Streptomyces TaxID=1883 RepID=UPI0033F18848
MARKTINISVTGNHTGDVNETVINGTSGPVALNGDVHVGTTQDSRSTGRTYTGKGMTVVEGDSTGTISRRF